MKSFIWRFVTDQSGALSFEDGLTIFSLTIGFIAAFALITAPSSSSLLLFSGCFPARAERLKTTALQSWAPRGRFPSAPDLSNPFPRLGKSSI